MPSAFRKLMTLEVANVPAVVSRLASDSPSVGDASVTVQSTKPARIMSVDMLRGIIMVIMALDHVRDYFTNVHFDPADLTQTTVALFFTRWITHFCAPVFVFLAGTGAFLSASRGKPIGELARFLWTRGLMLVIFEATVVRFAWLFNFSANLLIVQVIWAIGVSMICLAAFVYLSKRTIAIIGIVMIVGHNALDGIKPETFGSLGWLWGILHVSQPFQLSPHTVFFPIYPLIPWIGVMAAGYVFGSIMLYEPDRRKKTLLQLGTCLTALFVIIRGVNVYGDLVPWTAQKDAVFTVLSFINTTKYPPSLDYLLMTLGPSILALALFERAGGKMGQFFVTYGRVPMFYYIVHLYVIHALAIVAGAMQGFGISPFFDVFLGYPRAYGFGLAVVYMVWIGVVLALYPLCRWFGELKRRRKDVWLSYL